MARMRNRNVVLKTESIKRRCTSNNYIRFKVGGMASSGKSGSISVVLGTMTFGWNKASETCGDGISQAMLDTFVQSSDKHVEVDTAFLYSGGETENIIGRLLPNTTNAGRLEIATKAAPWGNLIKGTGGVHGASGGAGGLSPECLRMQVETSLQRMGTKRVHTLYLHAPDAETPLKASLAEVDKLHKEGKFTELGLSNFSAWEIVHCWHLCHANGFVQPTVYQGMYNAITRQVEAEVFPACKELGIRFLCYNPLAAGILTGKHDFSKAPSAGRFKDNSMYMARYWKKEYFEALADVQEACLAANEPNLASVSLRWLKHHSKLDAKAGDGIIIGSSSVKHLVENLKACDEGNPLANSIVEALENAWKVCEPVCPLYFRGHSKQTGSL